MCLRMKKFVKQGEKELGVVVSVDSDEAVVGMYNVTNGASYFIDGEEINGIKVGAYAILKQGRNRIVVTVLSEKVRDQLNTINSKEFDNRFHAQSIQRIVRVKSQGVIKEGQFSVTSSTVPMVGNVLVSASSEDIAAIFSRGVDEEKSVTIGRSLMENQPIRIPINDFFASKNVDTECKETFALLLSKMLYENKKNDSNCASVHLIIDEAHNILNSFKSTHSDVWEDYRLTTFETMIKEGRKYGFFLTIASQRPADISPTIMSQIHNYIIHKLVNDKDLQMLENTMPTLDAFSKSRIPTLGKGEAVLTGRAFGMPSLIKVDYEEYSRPDSDDVDLIAAWSENPEASK